MSLFSKYPKQIYGLVGLSFISRCLTFVVPLISAILITYTDMSSTQVSLTLAFVFLVGGILQPTFGRMLDKGQFLLNTVLSVTLFTCGIFIFLLDLPGSPWMITACICVIFALEVSGTGLRRCIIGGVQEDMRGDVGTFLYVITNAGLCVAGLLAFFFLNTYRNELFIADLLSTVGVMIVAYFALKKYHPSSKDQRLAAQAFQVMPFIIRYWKTCLGVCLAWVTVFVHAYVLPLLYAQEGIDTMKWFAFLIAVNTATVMFFGIPLQQYLRKYSQSLKIGVGCILFGVSHIVIPYFLTPLGIAITTFVSVLGEIALVAPLIELLYKKFDQDTMGIASGLDQALKSIGMFMCPVTAVGLFYFFEDAKLGFALMYAVVPLVSFLLLRLDE